MGSVGVLLFGEGEGLEECCEKWRRFGVESMLVAAAVVVGSIGRLGVKEEESIQLS